MHAYHLETLHAVLDIPLHQELQLGGLQKGGAGGFALQPLVPGQHIITEEHTQDVSNATVMCYASLQVTVQICEARVLILSALTASHASQSELAACKL